MNQMRVNTTAQVFVSYPREHEEHAVALAAAIDAQGDLQSTIDRHFSAGANWHLELPQVLSKCNVFVALLIGSSPTDWQLSEVLRALENAKARRQPLIIAARIGDAEMPFGLERLVPIDLPALPTAEDWARVALKIGAAWSQQQATPGPTECTTPQHWRRELATYFLGPLERTFPTWLAAASNARELIDGIPSVLVAIRSILRINKPSRYEKFLSHSNLILTHLERACLDRQLGGKAALTSRDFSIRTPDDCLIVSLAAVLHNLCLLDDIPGYKPDGHTNLYDKGRLYLPRFDAVEKHVLRQVRDAGHQRCHELVQVAFRIALEMYEDYVFGYKESTSTSIHSEHGSIYDFHKKWWNKSHTDRYLDISRAMRTIDSLDVSHRVIPDLVTAAFFASDFPGGAQCFFEHGQESSTQEICDPQRHPRSNAGRWTEFILSTQFDEGQLIVEYIDADSPSLASNPITRYFPAIADTVAHSLKETHEKIWGGRSPFPNLDIPVRLVPRIVKEEISPDAGRHWTWAFLSRALIMEPSDTASARLAVSLMKAMLEHIEVSQRRYWETKGLDPEDRKVARSINRYTREYLQQLERMRFPSALMSRIVRSITSDLALVSTTEAHQYSLRVQKTMQRLKQQPWLAADPLVWPSNTPRPTHMMVYGASKPIASWIAHSLSTLQSPSNIQILHCVRRISFHAGIGNLGRFIPGEDHSDAVTMIGNELNRAQVPYRLFRRGETLSKRAGGLSEADVRVLIDSQVVGHSALPRICSTSKPVVVLGARGVVAGENGGMLVIYGAHALAHLCKSNKIDLYVVTWSDIFGDDDGGLLAAREIEELRQEEGLANRRYSISYSHTPRPEPDTEYEILPLDMVTCVITEGGILTGREAAEKASCHQELDAKPGAAKRQT